MNVSPWVNSGLAKGGSGDVPAGLIGGLLAQQPYDLFEMASLGVFIHGYAADVARRDLGETGMRATECIRSTRIVLPGSRAKQPRVSFRRDSPLNTPVRV